MLNDRVRVDYPGYGMGNHKMGVLLDVQVVTERTAYDLSRVASYAVVRFDDNTYEAVELSRCKRAVDGY